jgi:hypothetical protein
MPIMFLTLHDLQASLFVGTLSILLIESCQGFYFINWEISHHTWICLSIVSGCRDSRLCNKLPSHYIYYVRVSLKFFANWSIVHAVNFFYFCVYILRIGSMSFLPCTIFPDIWDERNFVVLQQHKVICHWWSNRAYALKSSL